MITVPRPAPLPARMRAELLERQMEDARRDRNLALATRHNPSLTTAQFDAAQARVLEATARVARLRYELMRARTEERRP